MKLCVSFILVICCNQVCSQKQLLPQANKLFDEKKYSEAIPLYDKIYEKKKDRVVLLKLADANYLNENYPQAQKYYAEYFQDSVYENIPQFEQYARSSKLSGKISLAVQLYQRLVDVTPEPSAKEQLEIYKLYVDSVNFTRSYDLDSNYNCVTIDATESLDTLAAPMFYNWEFDDGKVGEGLKLEHCFANSGEHKIALNIVDKKTGLVRYRDTLLVVQLEKLPVVFQAPQMGKRYFYQDFDASETKIAGYEIVDYLWNMDNGEVLSGKKIKYKYNESRDYWVKLVVMAQEKSSGNRKLFSANRKLIILENYETPSKKFSDTLNEAK